MSYRTGLDLAAAALLLAAVFIVWRRELLPMVRLTAVQGVALTVIALATGIHEHHADLIIVAIVILAVRAIILPWLLARAVGVEPADGRDSTPLLNTPASLLVTALLTVGAFGLSRPLLRLDSADAVRAVPAALAVVLIAVFVMITRRRAVSQAVGFLMLDNGIAATSLLLTAGVPLIVELGASLDVLFAVAVIGILTGRLRLAFGGTDLDQLRELHE